MFLAFFGALLATVSDGEACDAVAACRDEESLLQAMSKGEVQTDGNPTDLLSGTFCPDFFEAEDVQYASVGVQQVEKIFMKYCEDLGIAHEYCDQNAEAVFRPGGAGVQELTNDMCTDLLALRMKVMSESPTALLARQSSSGRDDESSVDDVFMRKNDPCSLTCPEGSTVHSIRSGGRRRCPTDTAPCDSRRRGVTDADSWNVRRRAPH